MEHVCTTTWSEAGATSETKAVRVMHSHDKLSDQAWISSSLAQWVLRTPKRIWYIPKHSNLTIRSYLLWAICLQACFMPGTARKCSPFQALWGLPEVCGEELQFSQWHHWGSASLNFGSFRPVNLVSRSQSQLITQLRGQTYCWADSRPSISSTWWEICTLVVVHVILTH